MRKPASQRNAENEARRKERSRPISYGRVRELLTFNPSNGMLYWKESRGRVKAGTVAATSLSHGYHHICIDYVKYQLHRIVWLYVYGQLPSSDIDHVNGDKLDNRTCNIRLATPSENVMNTGRRSDSTTKYRGVSFQKSRGRWRARFGKKHLGLFDTEEAAHDRYVLEVSIRVVSKGFPLPRHPAHQLLEGNAL